MINKYNNPQEIPERNYIGYIWEADETQPFILPDANFTPKNWGENSYVVEGLLYSETDNISILIRHTGEYQIREYDLNKLKEGQKLEPVSYLAHRLKGIKRVHFKQLWIPEIDENCLLDKNATDNDKNFLKVLKMKALLFTGFDNPKTRENA